MNEKKKLAVGVAMGALALAIAGCGNDSSNPTAQTPADPPAAAPNVLTMAGTAATGLALADATVSVKCAAGTGSATTNASGAYTVDVTDATLPCMLQVAGTAGGSPVVLHSVVEGSAAGSGTVTANVTPLTEMIVAQLAGTQPASLFDSFAAAPPAIDAARLTSATTAVVGALRTATGIDLGTIDPFKAPLVAATPSAPTGGNDYDRLLDSLGDKVPPAALPLVVAQIANAAAAAAAAPSGSTPPVTIADVFAGVAGGAMPHCPQVPSGSYRLLDSLGRMSVRVFDFASLVSKDASGTTMATISVDAAKPCEMTLTSTEAGRGTTTPATTALVLKVAMGAQGAGGYQSTRTLEDGAERHSIGYVFPLQSHPYSVIAGAWLLLESGFYADELNGWTHYITRLDFGAQGTGIGECEFTPSLEAATCTPRDAADLTLKAATRSDGGFDLTDDGEPAGVLYAFRAPNGTTTLFGSSNVEGASAPGTSGTSFVAKRQTPQVLPAVGSVTRYWDMSVTRVPGSRTLGSVQAPSADAVTVTAVDAAAGTVTRSRQSDSRVDVLRFNRFTDGIRVREPDPNNTFAASIQFPLGAGITPSVNLNQSLSATWFHAVSVSRP